MALVTGLVVASTQCAAVAPPPSAPNEPAATRSEEPIVLPTRRCGGLFIAETMIDGKGPYSMALDTGASVTAVSSEVAAETGAGSTLRRLEIGRMEVFGRIRYQVRDLDELGRAIGTPIDGILGHQVFQKALLTYDYPASEVRIGFGALTDDMPGVAPMSTSKRPFVGAEIAGREINVLLDTGSSQGLSLADLDRYAAKSPPRMIGLRVGVDGLDELRAARLEGSVRFGAFVLDEPVVFDATNDNLLGYGVLSDFVVTLDQRRGRVQIIRADGSAIAEPLRSPSLYGLDVALEPVPDGLRVRATFEGGAAAGRLEPGDVILAIDGISIADLGCARLSEDDSRPVTKTMRVRRGHDVMDVTVTTALQVP